MVLKPAETKGRASCGYMAMNKRGKMQPVLGVARVIHWLEHMLFERERHGG